MVARTLSYLVIVFAVSAAPVLSQDGDKVIGGSFESSWDAAVRALTERRIPIILADKGEGTIRADQSETVGEAPPGARFRYGDQPASREGLSIRFQRFSDNRTAVTIECKAEDGGECDQELIRELKDSIAATSHQTASLELPASP